MKTVFLILALLWLPSPSEATIFWTETFDATTCNWLDTTRPVPDGCLTVNSGVVQIKPGVGLNGSGALYPYYDYPVVGFCLPGHPNHMSQCGGYWDRSFTPSTEMWAAYYLYPTSSFIVGSPTTKIIKFSTAFSYSDWFTWYVAGDGSTPTVLALQNIPVNGVTTNKFAPDIPRNAWTCVEHHNKLNSSPGVSDGIAEIYFNGSLVTGTYDVNFIKAGQPIDRFSFVRVIRQDGSGQWYMDNLTVGNARIGCDPNFPGGGGDPLPDTSPPNAPTNLKVTELWERLKTVVATVWRWIGPASAEAATASSDQIVIRWEPRPGQRFTLDLTGFAWSGAKTFADLDAGLGTLTVPLPGLPPGQPGDDRWLCAKERDGKAVTGCNQLALGPIVLPPVPVPVPAAPPATVSMLGDTITIQCDKSRFTKMKTTGTGTKRVITCLK